MKYTKEERLDIGRQIYNGEISSRQAAKMYDICTWTAKDYCKQYREEYHLPPKNQAGLHQGVSVCNIQSEATGIEELESMTKEELIQELVKARIAEARLKKGYEVKGDGSVIQYSNRNTK